VIYEVETEPALNAQPALVDGAGFIAMDTDNFITADTHQDRAAHTALGANCFHLAGGHGGVAG
jgi:hypothetical protein